MLGRKQSVRNNEDWKNALDHIEETVSKKELDSLVKKTVKRHQRENAKGKRQPMHGVREKTPWYLERYARKPALIRASL